MKIKISPSLFSRKYELDDINKYFNYLKKTNPNFSYKKVTSLFFNLKKYFTVKSYKYFYIYCFDWISQWINDNEMYTEDYIVKLELLLKKLNLLNCLNSLEIEYINHFKSIIFAKKRNLKQLIVDFLLIDNLKYEKKERAYYQFENSSLFLKKNNNNELVMKGCNAYITNYRLVFSGNLDYLGFSIDKIQSYKLGIYGFEFVYNNQTYWIKNSDKYEFFVSYERMINLSIIKD